MSESVFTEYQKRWTKLIGGTNTDVIRAMTTGLDGSIYVGGQTLSTTLDGQPNNGVYDCFLAKYSADGKKLWTKVFGGNLNDSILAMTTGLDGFIYVGGITRTHLESNNEDNINGYISKYSPDGDVIWSRFIEGTSDDIYDSIDAMTTGLDGSIYVLGYTSSATLDGQSNAGLAGTYDVVLAKYTPDGEKLWTKLIGGSANESIRIMITGLDGSIYVGGYTSSTTLNGQANADTTGSTLDGFVAKYTPDGEKLWTKLIGGSGDEGILTMTTGLDGSIYVGGETNSTTLDGQANSGLEGTSDGFVAKYSPEGTKLWTKLIGGSGDEFIYAMTTGLDGSIYVGGATSSTTLDGQANADTTGSTFDGFVVKYTPEGTKLWTKLIGGSGDESIRIIITGLDGSIYVGGSTHSTTLDGQANADTTGSTLDVFVAKYSAEGTKLWTKLIGGSGDESIRTIITGLDGSIFVGGYTLSSILDGQYNADPTGITYDGFLARYSATSRPFRFRFPSKMEFSTKAARHFRAYESGRISYEPASIYWRISPKLPEGLKFNTKNGKISGTPTTVFGELSFTVIAYSSVYTTDRHRIKIRCIE